MVEIHSKDIVHRDIKPENIVYFEKEGIWKLIDLDYAGVVGILTSIPCSPPYASPEIIDAATNGDRNLYPDPSADMFSMGIVLCELITGKELSPSKISCFIWTSGKRFYGNQPITEDIKEKLTSGEPLYVPEIDLPYAKELIEALIKIHPKERLSAEDALKHLFFRLPSI